MIFFFFISNKNYKTKFMNTELLRTWKTKCECYHLKTKPTTRGKTKDLYWVILLVWVKQTGCIKRSLQNRFCNGNADGDKIKNSHEVIS